jgi:hypothetical protein
MVATRRGRLFNDLLAALVTGGARRARAFSGSVYFWMRVDRYRQRSLKLPRR